LAKGTIERIGGEAIIRLQVEGRNPQRTTSSLRDINAAVDFIARWAASSESGIEEIKSIADIQAVGHRVVHGRERFKQSVLITDEIVRAAEDCIDLAPLHNPANLTGITATRKYLAKDCLRLQSLTEHFIRRCRIMRSSTLCRISYTMRCGLAQSIH
jgi:acetate kinase